MNDTAKAVLGIVALSLPFLSGCHAKKKTLSMDPAAEKPVAEAAVEIGDDWTTVPGLNVVYFETDRADLQAEARTLIKENAGRLKQLIAQTPSLQVRIEGHCDERNTVEYNLALGERRAQAVRDYYAAMGIPKASLKTISFGEERPACAQSTDACWARNRRGVTTLRSPSGRVMIPTAPEGPPR
jgi:peptidoglycan-associated lipoprotein